MKQIHIIGGGTVFHVRPHLALSAPAYGAAAKKIASLCEEKFTDKMKINLHLTKMAGGTSLETNEDVSVLVDSLIEDNSTKIIFLTAALCDFTGTVIDGVVSGLDMNSALDSLSNEWQPLVGKSAPRLMTSEGRQSLLLTPAEKIVSKIRQTRKDIFLVACKTTAGATSEQMYSAGLRLLKQSSCNLVLVNDVQNKKNMIVTPEEAPYSETSDREAVLSELVDMTWHRSHLTFTRSTVIAGNPVGWNDQRVPSALRTVVDHCIKQGAYKVFNGSTVGHFAVKLSPTEFLTSIRKTNFNDLAKNGLVLVKTDGPDSVVAYGSRPSVGGQSQRIVFEEHEDTDCIVHFHCPKKPESDVPSVSQKEFECGSHECGQNTSNGLKEFKLDNGQKLWAVMLDRHGPNIVFNKSVDPDAIIAFIEKHFVLEAKTGGYIPT